jgi:hypothetical protein
MNETLLHLTREPIMDREKTQHGNGQDNTPPEEKKPIVDQMTDLAAAAAGTLAETAVKAGAKKAREEVAKRLPRRVKKAANTIAKAAKTPKKRSAKKTAKKSKSPAERTRSSARHKTVGKKTARRVAKKKKARGR